MINPKTARSRSLHRAVQRETWKLEVMVREESGGALCLWNRWGPTALTLINGVHPHPERVAPCLGRGEKFKLCFLSALTSPATSRRSCLKCTMKDKNLKGLHPGLSFSQRSVALHS